MNGLFRVDGGVARVTAGEIIASDAAGLVTGHNLVADGGTTISDDK